ncbi:MAG: 16S rRNA (guanine(527)-N(7))-methyltransferase RsmG [Phycisphaerae bacterium]|jgi:16S rRNA (guanine527-N7)-methyltransferase
MTHAELAAAGLVVDEGAYARLARFVTLLVEETQGGINLTSVRDEAGVWRKHVCDSLALLPLIAESKPGRLLDLGSGGGLPGVPIACVCGDVEVTLVDATRKKVTAVERIVRGVGLENVRLAWGRAETLAHEPGHREVYDAVTCRAVGALSLLVEWSAGFVRPGGVCWLFKTRPACEEEIGAAEQAARLCGMRHRETRAYATPEVEHERVIVVYEKERRLRAGLPRPPWRTGKRPL